MLQRPWAAQLTLPEDVLELSFDSASDHGLVPGALVDDDWSGCQAWSAGFAGSAVIVPSAALPGTKSLVLFGPLVRSPYGIAPLDPTVDLPTDPIADLAIVPSDLFRFVRWRGAPHAGYEAWLAGDPPAPPPVITVDRASR